MANYLKFNDGSVIEIEEGGYIGNYVYDAADETDGLRVANLVTPANVSHIMVYGPLNDPSEIETREEPNGEYFNLLINSCYFDVENLKVLISLREKTDIEIAIDEIIEEQEEQNEAIDYLAME